MCPETPCEVYIKIDDDTCVGYEVYVDGVYKFTEGQSGTPDGYCAFYVTEGTHTIEIRKNGCSASITKNFECGITYRWVSMPDYWCNCNKNCPSDVKFIGTATTDELTGWVCYGTYYCDVIVDKIISDPDNSIHVGSEYTVGYGSNPKYIKSGDKIEVDGSYYHSCGPLNQMGRICGDVQKILPDLVIEDITWATGTVCLGETITFTVTIKNIGKSTADSSTAKYYINNQYIDFDNIPSLSPGATSTRTFTWTASSCGNVLVKAIADANNDVQECYETNNVKQESIEIDGPDLIIQGITWPSGPVCLGKPVTITVKVKNQGECTAGASTVKYYVDNKYIGYDSIPVLGHGSTSTQTFTWTASSCGNVPVKAVADANNDVHECYENNNEKQKSFEVDGPDLIIQDITWPTGPVCLDKLVTITVKVKNQGGCTAGASTVKYYVDNKYVDSDTISSLSHGSTSTQTFTWTASSCGNVSVKAVADANNDVHECYENNNEKQKSIEVDGPDLIIKDIAWPSGTICLDKQVNIEVTTENIGKCPAEGPFTVKLYVDNQQKGTVTINYLGDGDTKKSTFAWTPTTCGIHSIKAVADAENKVHECNENNNVKQKSMEVDGPDLIIQDITLPTGPLCLDKPVTITVKVKNYGGCAAGSSTVKYYVDNQYHDSDTISSLNSGRTSTQTFIWTPTTCGNHNIKAVADANNDVHECDENNNDKQKSIEVDGPDLIIQDITLPTGPVCLGKPVTIAVKVKNQGGCAAGASTVKYYVDNQYNGSDTISSLNSGRTSTQTFTWTPTTCGTHNIKAVADANNNVKECDENNNEKTRSVNVKCPDLIVEDIAWNPPDPELDESITFTVTISNRGECDAKASHAKFLIDETEFKTVSVGSISAGSSATRTFTWTASGCGDHNVEAIADCNGEVTESDEVNIRLVAK